MQNNNNDSKPAEAKEYKDYRRMKQEEEARANLQKTESDCLSPFIDKNKLKDICKNAEELPLGAIVVYPAYVKAFVAQLGKDPKCALIAAISYPHGLDTTEIKVAAVKRAIKDGVDEVEVNVPIQLIRDGNISYFKRECKKLKKAARNVPVRLVFDCAVLTPDELAKCCALAADKGIRCVRLNNADGNTVSAIKRAVRDKCLIKAESVESFSAFANYCVMGADYIGSKNAMELAKLIKSQIDV